MPWPWPARRLSPTRKTSWEVFPHAKGSQGIRSPTIHHPGDGGWREATLRTILLLDVRRAQDGLLLTDHLWFTCGTTFDRLHLHPGDRIQFDARVAPNEKGYQGPRAEKTGEAWWEVDYRLERPTKAIKLP